MPSAIPELLRTLECLWRANSQNPQSVVVEWLQQHTCILDHSCMGSAMCDERPVWAILRENGGLLITCHYHAIVKIDGVDSYLRLSAPRGPLSW